MSKNERFASTKYDARPVGAHIEAPEAHLEALLEPVCCPSWDCGDLENVRFVYAKRYFLLLEAILK